MVSAEKMAEHAASPKQGKMALSEPDAVTEAGLGSFKPDIGNGFGKDGSLRVFALKGLPERSG